jgi:hypothetical protein
MVPSSEGIGPKRREKMEQHVIDYRKAQLEKAVELQKRASAKGYSNVGADELVELRAEAYHLAIISQAA